MKYILLVICIVWSILWIVGVVYILYVHISDYIRVKTYYKQRDLERKGIKTKFIL